MKKSLIKIKTEKEFDNLLAQGYKVVNSYSRFSFSKGDDEELKSDYNYGYIFLEKEDEQLTVDCSEVSPLFATQYRQIADIDGNFFDKVQNHNERADVEMYTYDHFDTRRKPCVHIEAINSSNTEKIIQYLKAYVENEIVAYSRNNLGRNLVNIFSNAILITENNDRIDCEIFDKNTLDIQKINELRHKASTMQNCFAFSFFYIYSKSKKSEFHPDFFIGCILYDLKNQKSISFNLTSTFEEVIATQLNSAKLFTHCCRTAFEKSIQGTNFLSIMHVSIMHATYTPLPWMFFSALYPFEYAKSKENEELFINIPELFTFGISKDLNSEDSFYYTNIRKDANGSALIQFDFFNGPKINYQLRIDTSRGEEFIHIDFGYYLQKGMNKLLSHFPIDMSLVKNFSNRMFISIVSAGFYDPEFVGILKYKLKNIIEMIKEYNELSEPLKIIHNAEATAKWLEENQLFNEFEKIHNNDKDIDMKKYYKISNEFTGLFGKNKEGIIGFSHAGLMVLVRKYDGPDSKLYFIQKYLDKRPTN